MLVSRPQGQRASIIVNRYSTLIVLQNMLHNMSHMCMKVKLPLMLIQMLSLGCEHGDMNCSHVLCTSGGYEVKYHLLCVNNCVNNCNFLMQSHGVEKQFLEHVPMQSDLM